MHILDTLEQCYLSKIHHCCDRSMNFLTAACPLEPIRDQCSSVVHNRACIVPPVISSLEPETDVLFLSSAFRLKSKQTVLPMVLRKIPPFAISLMDLSVPVV